jgi:hypothetical protein
MQLQKLDPIFHMGNGIMMTAYNFEPKYSVIMLTTEESNKGPGSPPVVEEIIWYTDESRTQMGAGAGVYRQFLGR